MPLKRRLSKTKLTNSSECQTRRYINTYWPCRTKLTAGTSRPATIGSFRSGRNNSTGPNSLYRIGSRKQSSTENKRETRRNRNKYRKINNLTVTPYLSHHPRPNH